MKAVFNAKENSGGGPGYITYPEYEITTTPFKGRIRVFHADHLLAESHHAILLTETDHSRVYYLPRADVRFDLLEEFERSTFCPFKGHASYWRIGGEGAEQSAPIVWGYATPFEEVASLSEYVAFYSDRVRLEVE